MSLTYNQLKAHLQDELDDDSATFGSMVERALNWSMRQVARQADWPELEKTDVVQTTAPYSASTVTVTNGSKTVTGAASVWTEALHKGRKFALSYASPWSQVDAVASNTSLTLRDNYLGSTSAGETYLLYEDRVSMPSNCQKILHLWVHDADKKWPMREVGEETIADWRGYPGQSERPRAFVTEGRDASDNILIRVGPFAPDIIYNLEVKYRARITNGHNPFEDSREDLLISGALLWLYRRDKPSRVPTQFQMYKEHLAEELSTIGEAIQSGIVGEINDGRRVPPGTAILTVDDLII